MKIKIINDVFNICNRIKQINKGYFILYNKKNNKFEVHNSKYKNTLCLTLPYKTLDFRTLNYVRQSENVEEVIKNINTNNQRIETQEKQNYLDRVNYQLNEIYKYANSKTGFSDNAYKNKWY